MSLHLVGDSYSKLIPQWHKMTSCLVGDNYSQLIPQWHQMTSCLVGDNYSQLLPQWHQMTLCPAGWQMQPPGTQLTKNDMVDRLPSGTVQHCTERADKMILYPSTKFTRQSVLGKILMCHISRHIQLPHIILTHKDTLQHHTDTQGHLTLVHNDTLHLYTSTPQIPTQHRHLYWTEFWRIRLHKDMIGLWKIDLVYGCVKCRITNN